MESTPGPWYSTMAPVPPFTVRIPATFRITSFGEVQPDRVPVSFTPITWGRRDEQSVIVREGEERRQEKNQKSRHIGDKRGLTKILQNYLTAIMAL